MIYLVDVERDLTTVHRLDTKNGVYMRPIFLRSEFQNQITDLVKCMIKDRCEQVIFNKYGYGDLFSERFKERAGNTSSPIAINEQSVIEYKI